VTADSLTLQNAYSARIGHVRRHDAPDAAALADVPVDNRRCGSTTDARVAMVGIRSNGTGDTLRVISEGQQRRRPFRVERATADPSYISFRAVALLSSADARTTPVLRSWSADFEPPADLAISSHTLAAPKIQIQNGAQGSVTLSVYNIGYRKSDSARVILSSVLADNSLPADRIRHCRQHSAGGSRTVQISFPTAGLPAQFTLQARGRASFRRQRADLWTTMSRCTISRFSSLAPEGGTTRAWSVNCAGSRRWEAYLYGPRAAGGNAVDSGVCDRPEGIVRENRGEYYPCAVGLPVTDVIHRECHASLRAILDLIFRSGQRVG